MVVRKANRIITVSENEAAKYLSKGYEVIGGEPVETQASTVPEPDDIRPITQENVIEQPKPRKRRR